MAKRLAIPVIVILIGVTWMLDVMRLLPSIDWFWTVGLLAGGVFTVVLGGLDKFTFVVGGFLVAASGCSVLRTMCGLTLELEMPILVTVLGVLMFFATILPIPTPEQARAVKDDRKPTGVAEK